MGRRDAVAFTLECVAEWRRMGALVTFEPGWERRGNGTAADYEGASEHHTATPSSLTRPFPTRSMLINGRTGLPGPLCNDATPVGPGDQPHIHVIAAHPANHGGASGGRLTAPLPVTRLFNPRARGNEIDYGGDKPMTPGQYKAALIHGRGVVNVLRRGTEYIKAHAETSITGKWDPGYAPGKTIDMNAFRRDAAALGSAAAPAVPPTSPQQKEIDLMFVNLAPGDHLTFPRPNGGQVDVKLAFDNNGTPGLDVAEQRVRVAIHNVGNGGGWRNIYPNEKEDTSVFWMPQGETRGFSMTPFDDILVVRNLHSSMNLGVTITHTA